VRVRRHLRELIEELREQAGEGLRGLRVSFGGGRVRFLGGVELAAVGQGAAERAQSFVGEHGRLFGFDGAEVEAKVGRVFGWRGGEVVKIEARHRGLPVFGRGLSVRVRGGVVTGAAGNVPAVRWPEEEVLLPGGDAVERTVREKTGLAVRVETPGYWIRGAEAVLVWKVVFRPRFRPGRLVVLVSNRSLAGGGDLELVGVGSDLVSARSRVFPQNPVASDLEMVSLSGLVSSDALEGTKARAFQCNGPEASGPDGDGGDDGGGQPVAAEPFCAARSHTAGPDASGDFFYQPDEPSLAARFAEAQAYYHVTEFAGWLEQRFGFEWSCGQKSALDVHVNMDWPDAFYGDTNGDEHGCKDISLGQGAVDFSYDAEVVYHEAAHAMVDGTAGLGGPFIGMCADSLGLNLMPTAINEAFADYFSATFTGDPYIGEYAAGQHGTFFLRSLANERSCPGDVNGEPHHDGMVLSGALWSLRRKLGAQKVDHLAYGTLIALPRDAEYADVAQALVQAAAELKARGVFAPTDVRAVEKEIGPQSRNLAACSRIVGLAAGRGNGQTGGRTVETYAPPTYPGYLDELPLPVQYRIDVGDDVERLSLTIEALEENEVGYRVYVSRDEPVGVDVQWTTPEVEANHVYGSTPGVVELDRGSAPRLTPNTTYYVAIVYAAADGQMFRVGAELDRGDVDPDLTEETIYGPGPSRPEGLSCRMSGDAGGRRGGGGSSGRLPVLFVIVTLAVITLWARRKPRRR
jgi:hypothetical protein